MKTIAFSLFLIALMALVLLLWSLWVNAAFGATITHSHCPNHSRNNSDNMHTHDTSDPDHNDKHKAGHPHTWEFDEHCPPGTERDTSKKSNIQDFPTKPIQPDNNIEKTDTGIIHTPIGSQIFPRLRRSTQCATKWYANEKVIINRIGLTRGAYNGRQHTYTLTSLVLLKDDASIIDLSGWTLSLSAKFSAYTYTLALDDLAFDGNTLELTADTLSPDRSVFGLTDRERQPLFDYRLKNGRGEYVDMAITGSPIANAQDRFSQEDTVVLLRQPHAGVSATDWRQYQCNMWVIETAPSAPSLHRNKTTTWASLKRR